MVESTFCGQVIHPTFQKRPTVMPISGDEYKEIGRAAAGAVSVVAAYDRRK